MSADPVHTVRVLPESTRVVRRPWGLLILVGVILLGIVYQAWMSWMEGPALDPRAEIQDVTWGTNPRVWTITALVDPETGRKMDDWDLLPEVRLEACSPRFSNAVQTFRVPLDWEAEPGWARAEFSLRDYVGKGVLAELWVDPPRGTVDYPAPVAYRVMVRFVTPDGKVLGKVHEKRFPDRLPGANR